jgi:hypothetical protein
MATTGAAAVNTMVKGRFDATSFTPIVGAPEYGSINVLEDKIAKVMATFKTTRCGGEAGCLALIVDEVKMRRVAKAATLSCARSTMPVLLNPKITDKTSATDEKTLVTKYKQTWYEYYLDQAVNLYGVATIVASTDP